MTHALPQHGEWGRNGLNRHCLQAPQEEAFQAAPQTMGIGQIPSTAWLEDSGFTFLYIEQTQAPANSFSLHYGNPQNKTEKGSFAKFCVIQRPLSPTANKLRHDPTPLPHAMLWVRNPKFLDSTHQDKVSLCVFANLYL